MAITATVDLGNGISKASCYIIVPIAYVRKFAPENDDQSATFKLIYDVHIYQNKSDRDSYTRRSKKLACREVDHHKITYENGEAVINTINPHSELTWTKVKAEMDRLDAEYDSLAYSRAREELYPVTKEFMEAYTEKEIGGDSTKWDAYVTKYNKVRSDNPKP